MAYSGSYNPNVGLIKNRKVNLSKNLHFYSSKYENVVVIGDFNAEMTNSCLEEFCESGNYNRRFHAFKTTRKKKHPRKNTLKVRHFQEQRCREGMITESYFL